VDFIVVASVVVAIAAFVVAFVVSANNFNSVLIYNIIIIISRIIQ